MVDSSQPTKCPACGSRNWKCWDESLEWFKIKTDSDYEENEYDATKNGWIYFEIPVGGLTCTDCGHTWKHALVSKDAVYVGSHYEMEMEFYDIDPDDYWY